MPLIMAGHQGGWAEGSRKISTHCSYCALQCGLNLTVDLASNKVTQVRGRRDFPTTKGLSCVKGQTAHLQLDHGERLTQPLLRQGDEWTPISWDLALDIAAERIQALQARDGADAMACYGSGALTNETVYLLGKFARLALRSANIDYNGRYCMSSAAAAQNTVLGVDRGLHFPLDDLKHSRCIVLVGANVAECLPPIATFIRHAKRAGCKVIVVDPRGSDSSGLADLHLKPRPGTDLALALALAAELDVMGALDRAYLDARCSGVDEALASARGHDADWAQGVSGVPAADLRQAARWLGSIRPSLILTGRGAEQHVHGPETAMAFLQVALLLGQVGTPGGGFGTLTGQGNGQGGREHGQKADQLPGYRSIKDPGDRAAVAKVWGVDPADLPGAGLSAQELFQAGHRHAVRGLWVVASNPAVSAAKAREVRESLAGLDFLMVSDLFFSETCRLAHLVLPAAAFAEEEGTMTNIEGRVVLRRAAVRAPGQARPDWRAIRDLARRLGRGHGFDFDTPEAIFAELARATAGARADYSGMNYTKLERNKGIFWPCRSTADPGTQRLFQERFAFADGRARLQPLGWLPLAEAPDAEYPLTLTTGRVLQHYLSGNQTRRIPVLAKAVPQAYVQVSASLALERGLEEGGLATVRTRRGALRLPVSVNADQEHGTLFIPMHFGGDGCANDLTIDALAPLSKMPEFKACAADISPVEAAGAPA
jgi:assimilatory nitrate reductase catalytic subunit